MKQNFSIRTENNLVRANNEKTSSYCKVCSIDGSSLYAIRNVSNCFNQRLKEILSGDNDNYEPLDLGCPSSILLQTGLPNLPIQISVKKLMIKKEQPNHPFRLSDVAHLPEYLCHPIAVFRSASTVEERKVVLTEMQCNDTNLVVVIAPNQNYRGYFVNDIRSIYPKDNVKAILLWIVENDLLEYANKQKILEWLSKQPSDSAEVTHLIKEATKIIEKS